MKSGYFHAVLRTVAGYMVVAAITLSAITVFPQKSGNELVQLAAAARTKMPAGSGAAEARRILSENGGDVMTTSAAAARASEYDFYNVEFSSAAARKAVFSDTKVSKMADAHVLTTFDRFADILASSDAVWDALWKTPGIYAVEPGGRIQVPPPPDPTQSTLGSQAIPDEIVRNGHAGLTGKGVTIAIIDTGVDFRHPDFITYDAAGRPTSRISYLWDTSMEYVAGRGSKAPVILPNGTSAGTLFTRDQLTAELRAATPTIPATDLDGRGTACASIAAGNGNADRTHKRREVIGVAPEATIIGVRMGQQGFENGYLLNTIMGWLDITAWSAPLVVSGSFGGHYTGHDGQTIEERQMSARFPLTKAGRALVLAAGNEAKAGIHAKANFSNTPKTVSWNAARATVIKMYFDSADTGLSVMPTATTPIKDRMRVSKNPITGQFQVRLTVDAGPGSIILQNTLNKPSAAHLYFTDRSFGRFAADSVVQSHLVGTPGGAANAITVGSYDWNDNFLMPGAAGPSFLTSVCRDATGNLMPLEIRGLSCYSSPGPLRTGVVKPEIVAPGEWYSSANAMNRGVTVGRARVDSTGMYRAMNGTSAATPYTSGIIALLFQKKPTLTLGALRDLLKLNVTKTGLTPFGQSVPNDHWGYGKLDKAAVDKIFAAVQ